MDRIADARSTLALVLLAARTNGTVRVTTNGLDEIEAIEAVRDDIGRLLNRPANGRMTSFLPPNLTLCKNLRPVYVGLLRPPPNCLHSWPLYRNRPGSIPAFQTSRWRGPWSLAFEMVGLPE